LQKIEFLSLEQGQSETISGPTRRRPRSSAPERPRARRTPPRRTSPLAPSRGSFPEATHVPRPPQSLPPPRAARRPAGSTDGPPVRSLPPLLFAPPEAGTHSHGRRRGPLRSLAGPLAAHKRGIALTPRHAHGRAAAGAMDGSHDEASVPAGAGPNKPLPTFPCTCPSSPACCLPRSPITPPAQQAAAATVLGRRRRPSPTPSPAQSTPGIGPLGPKAPPPPVPGRPRSAVGRNLAGPPLPGRPGTTLQRKFSLRGPPCKRVTQIVKVTFLFLVNCV
jgi:hypothetical protein